MNCIAIDDSANALELLKLHIAKISFLELKGVFQSAPDAIQILNREQIDLIFLDIEMPDITGIQFAKSLEKIPMIIFTTAHREYALEGFEVNAVDYLLKPISFDRFLKATNKAYSNLQLKSPDLPLTSADTKGKYILFKSGNDVVRLHTQQIAFLESQGNYIKVQLLNGKTVLSLLTMAEAMNKLTGLRFFRCHRSFIIALDQIQVISTHQVKVFETLIPIGKNYRREFQKMIQNDSI